MTWEQIVRQAQALPLEQRKQLIALLVDSLVESATRTPARSILDLKGVGDDLWREVNVPAYIDALRGEWEGRA